MNGQTNGHQQRFQITTSTGVSVGIIVLLLAGFGTLFKVANDTKSEAIAAKSELSMTALQTKNELTNSMNALSARMTSLESSRTSWTSTDMFKWAVHLQQANPQIKVPEPEVTSK